MKLLSKKDFYEWDQFTIHTQNVSIETLVKNASTIFANWVDKKLLRDDMRLLIVCGNGNNAADGFCLASILKARKAHVEVAWIAEKNQSKPCEHYKNKWDGTLYTIHTVQDLPVLENYHIVIDGIFGIGLDRPVDEKYTAIFEYINQHANHIQSIDIPSGMFADIPTHSISIQAHETLTFQVPKFSFFYQSNADRLGHWIYRDVGLDTSFLNTVSSDVFLLEKKDIKPILSKRNTFTHKGSYGSAIIVGGAKGMAGAVQLAGKASYRVGAGLVRLVSVAEHREILQLALPEATFHTSIDENIIRTKMAIGFGVGMYRDLITLQKILAVAETNKIPIVLDGGSLQPELITRFSPSIRNAILTPHPTEFDRVFGTHENDIERRNTQIKASKNHGLYIILKDRFTTISTPEGKLYFSTLGNPGMATGGTGDILTGILTGLLAQGYTPLQTCLLGTYLHGTAGDLAAKHQGQEFMIAGDLIPYLKDAFRMLVI